MQKGYTLVHLLVLIVIVPIFMAILARLFNTLMTETPRLWDNVQQNATMLNMLSHIQSDIDKATDFPKSYGDFKSNDKLLLIEQANTLICYELVNEHVVRRILTNTLQSNSEPTKWLIPEAKIEWNILNKDDKPYAIEIRNHIEYEKGKRTEKKMANSHLYFIGAL